MHIPTFTQNGVKVIHIEDQIRFNVNGKVISLWSAVNESEEWQVWSADRENVGTDFFDTDKSMELFGAKLEKAKELLAKVKGESV